MYADLSLARRLERLEATACARFVEARATLNPASNATWHDFGGTYAMFDSPGSPITQTFGLGLFSPVTEHLLEAIEHFFKARNAPTNHEVSPIAGVDTFALLTKRGYVPIELTSVLYRDTTQPLEITPNPHVTVRIANPDEHDLWARVGAIGWSTELPEAADFMMDLGRVIAAKNDAAPFLAEIEGEAAGSAALSFHEGAALLAGASTVPAARRQGVQLALLDARLKFAVAHNCDLAMMGAACGSTSQRNAERNGFRIAYTRVKWQLA